MVCSSCSYARDCVEPAAKPGAAALEATGDELSAKPKVSSVQLKYLSIQAISSLDFNWTKIRGQTTSSEIS
ncbi:hypothetical protein IEQ34_017745 [Dendrobium chrysotoxum]|uniref:Uncharacterized protein n=1 Tax=Dendrobium chrysotoxum TaxID=161865 RepID=A0AAV7GAG9_DENCH|nr:hypothetical protein IEQ34_017745 [Dendrobium chrysotoxum]